MPYNPPDRKDLRAAALRHAYGVGYGSNPATAVILEDNELHAEYNRGSS